MVTIFGGLLSTFPFSPPLLSIGRGGLERSLALAKIEMVGTRDGMVSYWQRTVWNSHLLPALPGQLRTKLPYVNLSSFIPL